MTLIIDSLDVSYGGTMAVRNLSLRVDDGEMVTLVGPNGAGKTSTLRAIFGLAPVRSGRIFYRGESLVGRRPEDIAHRGLALVPEGRHIFQTLTVAENLRLGLAAGRGDRGEALRQALALFPKLDEYYSMSAGGLSGGEQQQLAIARALVARTEFLMLDEPSLGLAPLVVTQVFEALSKLRDRGVTILLVEQNAARAMELADRTYILRSGQLVAQGSASELLESLDLGEIYLGGPR